MEPQSFGFEELKIWQKARDLKKQIRITIQNFPSEERYRLSDQIIRSSRSVNDLISEGHGRFTFPDQIHFCVQARGSLTETFNHLIHAFDEAYINTDLLNSFRLQTKELERMINAYILYLRKRLAEKSSSIAK